MKIQILGTGCHKCRKLEENAKKAVEELNLDKKKKKITDLNEIMKYSILMTPGFAINKNIKSAGKVLTFDQIKDYLQKELP